MSDAIKIAIADALAREARERHSWRYNPYGLAEVAFDAAVEAGMAPPVEVERLRGEWRAIRVALDEAGMRYSVAHLSDGVADLAEERDGYREALERAVEKGPHASAWNGRQYNTCPRNFGAHLECRCWKRDARAALDGEGQREGDDR